jgi:hypothetical protein
MPSREFTQMHQVTRDTKTTKSTWNHIIPIITMTLRILTMKCQSAGTTATKSGNTVKLRRYMAKAALAELTLQQYQSQGSSVNDPTMLSVLFESFQLYAS